MKLAGNLIKLGLALAAVAGTAYLIVKYMDTIKAWLDQLCAEVDEEETVLVTEEPEAAAPAEEPVPVETVEEPKVEIEEGTPVAEETDFEA